MAQSTTAAQKITSGPSRASSLRAFSTSASASFAEVKDIKPDKPLRRPTYFLEAHKLATMPRSRYTERTTAAFWGIVAAIIPAGDAINDLAKTPPEPDLMTFVTLAILLVSLDIRIAG